MMKVGDMFEQNVNGVTVGLGKINMSTEAPSLVNSIESGEKFLGRKSDDGERCGERWPIPGTWTVLQEKRGRDRQRVARGRDILKGDPEARKKAKQYAAKYKEGHDRGLVVDGAKAAARDRFSSQEQETRQVRPTTAARMTIRKAVRGYQAKSEAERRRKERDREGFGQERRRWGRGRSRKRRGGRTKRHKGRRRRCPKTGKPICYCKPKIKSRRGGRRTRRRR